MSKDKNEIVIIKNLVKQVQELNAGVAHLQLSNIEGIQGMTAIISVYDGQKPAHMVLDELVQWAEGRGMHMLIEKIEQLEQDMEWNEEE